jgi:hypothetical protein
VYALETGAYLKGNTLSDYSDMRVGDYLWTKWNAPGQMSEKAANSDDDKLVDACTLHTCCRKYLLEAV